MACMVGLQAFGLEVEQAVHGEGGVLTLGSILVFFRLRHFSAHRSQFGCVIPNLDKNRDPSGLPTILDEFPATGSRC